MYAKDFLPFLSISFKIGDKIPILKEINIFLDVPYTVEGRAGKTARLTGNIRILSEGKGGRTNGRTYACFQQAEADRVVVSVFEEIMSAVTMGDSVTLIGFGSFRAVESAPRTGRNPATGEAIRIPAVRKPKFVAGTYFREIVNKYEGIKDEE